MNERTLAALNKVPEVTIAFWVIKILSTTVEKRSRTSLLCR